jgi:hypothetical protein
MFVERAHCGVWAGRCPGPSGPAARHRCGIFADVISTDVIPTLCTTTHLHVIPTSYYYSTGLLEQDYLNVGNEVVDEGADKQYGHVTGADGQPRRVVASNVCDYDRNNQRQAASILLVLLSLRDQPPMLLRDPSRNTNNASFCLPCPERAFVHAGV